jgi:hypothetical protein
MQERSHLLTEGAIQTLGDPIELGCVMDGESARGASGCEVLIKLLAQVLSPSIGAQDFVIENNRVTTTMVVTRTMASRRQ